MWDLWCFLLINQVVTCVFILWNAIFNWITAFSFFFLLKIIRIIYLISFTDWISVFVLNFILSFVQCLSVIILLKCRWVVILFLRFFTWLIYVAVIVFIYFCYWSNTVSLTFKSSLFFPKICRFITCFEQVLFLLLKRSVTVIINLITRMRLSSLFCNDH